MDGTGDKIVTISVHGKCDFTMTYKVNAEHVISVAEIASEKGKVRCCMLCQEYARYSSTSG